MKRKFVLGPIVDVIWCVVLHIHLTLNNHCWCIELFSFLLFFEKQYSIKKVLILLFNHERPREWLISMPAISPTSYFPRSRAALSCTRAFVFLRVVLRYQTIQLNFLKVFGKILVFIFSQILIYYFPLECQYKPNRFINHKTIYNKRIQQITTVLHK